MKKIWFRVGMEAEITDEEMDMLLIFSNQKGGKINTMKVYDLMVSIVERGELSGETYIVGKTNGGVDDYDNPDYEVNFLY